MTRSRLEVVLFPSNALLWSLSSETTWVGSCVFGCSRVETRDMWMLPRDVTEKALLSRLQALSSFSLLMPPILEFDWMVGLVGVEARVQVKARAGKRSYERYSRDVQEPRHV